MVEVEQEKTEWLIVHELTGNHFQHMCIQSPHTEAMMQVLFVHLHTETLLQYFHLCYLIQTHGAELES